MTKGENSTTGQTARSILAGASERQFEGAGGNVLHGRASAGAGAAGGLGTRSGVRTSPEVMISMRAATRKEGARSRNRSLRTQPAETPPMRAAMSVSETDSRRIQSFNETMRLLPLSPAPDALSRALAVLTAEIVGALAAADRGAVLERITNRLDGHSRRSDSAAAAMLGAVGAALMAMEA